jgi:hypothetical protein
LVAALEDVFVAKAENEEDEEVSSDGGADSVLAYCLRGRSAAEMANC